MSLIVIGLDERCFCSQGDKCCLGRTGMASRCMKWELVEAGYKTVQVVDEKEGRNAEFAMLATGVDSRVTVVNIIEH